VIATLDRGGALEDHTADYLIGADGAHSKVRAVSASAIPAPPTITTGASRT
jgi:2-polyprenyl-6-methoxyphenol hydroxylase-like FAD-dependent oxidoreductase